MKIAAICVTSVFGLASAGAAAQGVGEAMEKLSRDIAPPPPRAAAPSAPAMAPAADNWIVSETTSPIDYTPIAIATASSGAGPDGASLLLSIQCRGGRTELVLGGPAVTRRVEDYAVSYGVDDGQPVAVTVGAPAFGTGIAIKGDVVRLLASLPDRGDVVFRLSARQGAALEGRFALGGLKSLLDRLAVPCKWPAGAPRR